MKYNFNSNTMTDADAIEVVKNYLKTDESLSSIDDCRVFVIWKCKTIQNVKFVLGVTCSTGYYSGNGDIFELTLNGDAHEIYLDCYTKYDKQIYELENQSWK